MSKSPLEQVKALAQELTPQERLELFDYLSQLPDSLIKPIPKRQPLPPLSEEEQKTLQRINVTWEMKLDGERITYSIEGREIFTASFNTENFVGVFYDKVKTDKIFLHVSDEQRTRLFDELRKRVAPSGLTPTDDELKEMEPEALRRLGQYLLKNSFRHTAKQIVNNLPRVVGRILNIITHAGYFAGANQLRTEINVPEQKFTPKQIKDELFGSEWEFLKPILGIGSRGGSDARVEVRDEQCKQLSTDYPVLLKHWQDIKANRTAKKNWRSYAKVDEEDTPDDLLNRLDDELPQQFGSDGEAYLNIPSALALEHAARRCGIPPNEYGLSTLKNLRLRGDSLLAKPNI